MMAMARKSAEDRRLELLEAAQRVIRRVGFAHLTLREVGAEAGVAHSLVRHYFGTRDELLAEAFDLASREERSGVELKSARPTPLDRLVAWCEPMDRDHYLMWIDAWSEAPRSPELKRTLRRFETECQTMLASLITEAVEAGALEAVDDPLAAAQRATATIDGLAIQHYALDRLTKTELRAQIRTALERELSLAEGTLAMHRPKAESGA
jgi:AcrR family transcriptional regulator